jgi:hypothetical protein
MVIAVVGIVRLVWNAVILGLARQAGALAPRRYDRAFEGQACQIANKLGRWAHSSDCGDFPVPISRVVTARAHGGPLRRVWKALGDRADVVAVAYTRDELMHRLARPSFLDGW